MKILITGATGFVGKHLVNRIFDEGHHVYITLLPNEKNPFHEIETTEFVLIGDYLQNLITFLSDNFIDGIIHLASFVQSGNHKSGDIEKLIDTNIKLSTILIESATIAEVKWFINAGTYWQHYNDEDYSPVNMYAATKQAFMDIAKYYWESNKIKFNTLILYDTYGSNDTRTKVFNLWEKIAHTREDLKMSPGEQIIDISHVDDVVAAFILLAKHLHGNKKEIENGSIYVVKAEKRYSLKEMAVLYEEVTGYNLNIIWGGKPYRYREVMIPWKNGVVVPGWIPKISLKDGIKKMFIHEIK